MAALPSHKHILTSLITSLSSTSPSQIPISSASASTSPLHTLSPNHRSLLLTLHVLFPTQLLPALDLLDRGLVTRLTLNSDIQTEDLHDDSATIPDSSGVYLVKSLATTLTRRNRDATHSSKRYVVHLHAWNCSCPNFTFEAFPSAGLSRDPHVEASGDGQEDQLNWSFGGMSLGNLGDAPCCRHLLACLLVDKWPDMTGKYAGERTVTKEEMAGIIADM